MTDAPRHTRPVGVFDSGVGGLSVLRHLKRELPGEDFVYFADSGFAPYGEKPESFIVERVFRIADFFVERRVKSIVVACNTATAAAIHLLRDRHPDIPVIGVEPGLKPALALSPSGIVGVLATEGTLGSKKFSELHDRLYVPGKNKIILQPCVGLADAIANKGPDSQAVADLTEKYVRSVIDRGADTVVLGCTHYPFALQAMESVTRDAGKKIRFVDTGEAIARQLNRRLADMALSGPATGGTTTYFTTGDEKRVSEIVSNLMKSPETVYGLKLP